MKRRYKVSQKLILCLFRLDPFINGKTNHGKSNLNLLLIMRESLYTNLANFLKSTITRLLKIIKASSIRVMSNNFQLIRGSFIFL